MGQLSTPLAEIPALFAEISARRVTRLSHINSEPAKQYFNIAAGISPLPSNSASQVTRLHINRPLKEDKIHKIKSIKTGEKKYKTHLNILVSLPGIEPGASGVVLQCLTTTLTML